MTVIRPNSISGITSITAQANEINVFRSDGTLAGLQLNGVNFNTTSGISTLAALNVTGNVSIAGTLTYEDVTNVDAIGIITARAGLNVSGGTGTFAGDVSIGQDLTYVRHITLADKIIHNGDTDTMIRFPAADTITAETAGGERVRIASDGDVGIGTVNPTAPLDVFSDTTATDKDLFMVRSKTGAFAVQCSDGAAANPEWRLRTYSNEPIVISPGNNERVRITSDGRVFIGETSVLGSAKLVVGNGGAENFEFTPASSTYNGGLIEYIHRGDANTRPDMNMYIAGAGAFKVYTNGANERLCITSDGKVGINSNAPESGLDVKHNDGLYIKSVTNANGAKLRFSDNSAYTQIGTIEYKHSDNAIVDGANDAFVIKGTESRTAVQIEGRLTVTQQPCASVYQCTGPSGNNITSDSQNFDPLHFDHIDIQQGNMTISNSNARIKVPIAGIYLVTYMISGSVSDVDQDDGIELILLKNGNEYPATNSRAEPLFNLGGYRSGSNEEEYFCTNHLFVECAKDDYLELALDNIDESEGTITRGNFGVMLMG